MSSSSSLIELTILSVEPHVSHVQDQVRHCVWLSEGLFAYLYVHIAASHVYIKKVGVFYPFKVLGLMYIYRSIFLFIFTCFLKLALSFFFFFFVLGLPLLNFFLFLFKTTMGLGRAVGILSF